MRRASDRTIRHSRPPRQVRPRRNAYRTSAPHRPGKSHDQRGTSREPDRVTRYGCEPRTTAVNERSAISSRVDPAVQRVHHTTRPRTLIRQLVGDLAPPIESRTPVAVGLIVARHLLGHATSVPIVRVSGLAAMRNPIALDPQPSGNWVVRSRPVSAVCGVKPSLPCAEEPRCRPIS